MLLLQLSIALLLISHAHGDCPILLSPVDVVVKYGDLFSVNCSTSISHHTGLSWEEHHVSPDGPVYEIFKSVDKVEDWEINITCYIHFNETRCSQNLPITIYKTPDSVSISTGTHTGPMTEGQQYELQCDVHNVAPVQNLIVRWYKGQTLVDQTSFTDYIRTPVNETAKLLINPVRADDGVQYRCEAELDLGEEGPQPPPTNSSQPLKINVQGSYAGCPLQLNPQSVVVRFGDPVSANCSTSVQHNGMGWEATVGVVPLSRDDLITWRVSNLTEWNLEAPFCYINLINGEQCELALPVTVYKTPDSVSISTGTHTGPMTEGQQYELQCDVHNVAPVQSLTVRWYKGQTPVDQTSFTDPIRTPVNETTKLLINPDRADDGVQYRCEAELDFGEEGPQPLPISSEPLNITVHYKPRIDHCQNWSPVNGTALFLYPNSVVGNPHPNITWKRSSSPVNTSALLTKYDSDEYEITASNELGSSSCKINITVEYPPELNCSENYTLNEETLFHPCPSDGLPKPELSLYKDGKLIQLPFHPKWTDSGLYQLTLNNRHGTTESNININIQYAPRISANGENFVVVEDDDLTLECNSSGNPEPEMWWSFENNTISTGRRYITFNIDRATSTSAGVYTCSAKNEVGQKNKTFTVEIKENYSYIPAVAAVIVVVLVLLFLVLLFIYFKRKKVQGSYVVTAREMRPLDI